jgi:3-phenylpropionate/cinnamic acid dioxygenase small subunit
MAKPTPPHAPRPDPSPGPEGKTAPARVSPVDDEYYATLQSDFTGWDRDDRLIRDPQRLEEIRGLLHREARALDQGRYADWLALYAPECLYWVPGSPGNADPRREITMSFDDRRRIEDRIYRLQTGYAWSNVPQARTSRLIGTVEAFSTADPAVCMVRSAFVITEFQVGHPVRMLSGWYGHRLCQGAGGWAILVKQVNLIDCDQNMRYPSVIL